MIDTTRLNPARPLAAAKKAGWWPPIWPRLWRAPERRFISAHQIVGRLVLESVRARQEAADWTAEQLAAFAPSSPPTWRGCLQPAEGMKTRELPGGTGPAAVASALDEAEARLEQWKR